MANPVPQGSHRGLSGVDPPDKIAAPESAQAVVHAHVHALDCEAQATSADRYVATLFAFVIFAAIVLAFVFGLLVCTKLGPSQVLQITGGATAISVAGFFGRNAIIVIGRRLITGSGNQ
jgi:hypothetical protein